MASCVIGCDAAKASPALIHDQKAAKHMHNMTTANALCASVLAADLVINALTYCVRG